MSSEVTRYVQAYALARQAPRRIARTLLALFFALIALAPMLLIGHLCLLEVEAGYVSWDRPIGLLGMVIAGVSGWMIVGWRERRARHEELVLELALRVIEAGYEEGSDEPGAVAIRAAFWQRAQRDALDSLRIRLASREQSRDMLDALRRPARQNKPMILICCGVWSLITLILSMLTAAQSGDKMGAIMSCWMLSAVALVAVTLYLLSLAGLGSFVKERVELRELRRETRRVVNLIETAGGLSLAEGEVRDILQGAIEPALGAGELEMSASEGGV
jgi:hypothetical protein